MRALQTILREQQTWSQNFRRRSSILQIPKAKTRDAQQQDQTPTTSSNAVLHDAPITSSACDHDGLSQPLMVTSWVRDFCSQKMLLDGGSLVELINRKFVARMRPRPEIFSGSRIKISLANDSGTAVVRICQDSG